MGIIRAGILSRVSGKVAGVVGGSWKNTAYLREYVIPANPNTDPQKAQRALMRGVVLFSKSLVGQIFNQYTDKFERAMSGFNRFVSDNILASAHTAPFSTTVFTNGKLWKPTTLLAVKSGTALTLTWDGVTLGNNGAASDKIYAAAYNYETGIWYFPVEEAIRSAGEFVITVPVADTATRFHCWLFAAQYSPTSPTLLQMISPSIHAQSTAP